MTPDEAAEMEALNPKTAAEFEEEERDRRFLAGEDDPAAFVGTPEAKERFFHRVALTLHRRLQLFT